MASEEEVAMNLSTEGKQSSDMGTSLTNSPSSVANGDIDTYSQVSLQYTVLGQPTESI